MVISSPLTFCSYTTLFSRRTLTQFTLTHYRLFPYIQFRDGGEGVHCLHLYTTYAAAVMQPTITRPWYSGSVFDKPKLKQSYTHRHRYTKHQIRLPCSNKDARQPCDTSIIGGSNISYYKHMLVSMWLGAFHRFSALSATEQQFDNIDDDIVYVNNSWSLDFWSFVRELGNMKSRGTRLEMPHDNTFTIRLIRRIHLYSYVCFEVSKHFSQWFLISFY